MQAIHNGLRRHFQNAVPNAQSQFFCVRGAQHSCLQPAGLQGRRASLGVYDLGRAGPRTPTVLNIARSRTLALRSMRWAQLLGQRCKFCAQKTVQLKAGQGVNAAPPMATKSEEVFLWDYENRGPLK